MTTPTASRSCARRRKAAGKRWSAASTVEWVDCDGLSLCRTKTAEQAPAHAVKAKVHYRLDGSSRKATFAPGGNGLADRVKSFQGLLVAAYANDWPADEKYHPIPPTSLPTATQATGQATGKVDGIEGASASNDRVPAALPTLNTAAPADVENVAAWYLARQKTTKKKRGGANRAGNTVGNYKNQIDFFLEFARYTEDDPRRLALGLPVGAPIRLDDRDHGLSDRDLLDFVSLRSATNLRTRGVNGRKVANWAAAAETEERNAAAEGRDAVIAPMPELDPEVCTARTVEAAARTIKAMLSAAYQYGRTPYQPWTAYVDDQVPAAAATSYTTRLLANPLASLCACRTAPRPTGLRGNGSCTDRGRREPFVPIPLKSWRTPSSWRSRWTPHWKVSTRVRSPRTPTSLATPCTTCSPATLGRT